MAAALAGLRPDLVWSGSNSVFEVTSAARPLFPQEQTFAGAHRTAVSCQNRTSGPLKDEVDLADRITDQILASRTKRAANRPVIRMDGSNLTSRALSDDGHNEFNNLLANSKKIVRWAALQTSRV
jgi:hypothetical protein